MGIPISTVFGPTDALRYYPWDQQADWLSEPEGWIEALSGAAVAVRLRLHLVSSERPLELSRQALVKQDAH